MVITHAHLSERSLNHVKNMAKTSFCINGLRNRLGLVLCYTKTGLSKIADLVCIIELWNILGLFYSKITFF